MRVRLPVVCMMALWLAGQVSEADGVGWIQVESAIGPTTAEYISRAIEVAAEAEHEVLVIELDTPGGLLESTQDIVQIFYGSPIPVVVYVSPSGANAGSAGCFITLAADIAAMAPNTSIGAAHPVALGGGGAQSQPDDTMSQKIENFAVSYIEAIAEKRGRNVEWARASVQESASITSEKALELGVIDLIAADSESLLAQLDGREIAGKTIETANATVFEIPMLVREKIFQVMWRPEVLFVLMLIAIYGIVGELSNPGGIIPGVVGVVALILALYMASILPVNIAGIALMALAVALFVGEALTPTFGLFTVGGAIAFLLGALLLFDRVTPAFRLSLAYIIPATALTVVFFVFIVGAGLRAQRLPVRAGTETLVGAVGLAVTDLGERPGRIFVQGEDWRAISRDRVSKGQRVVVESIRGLSLNVKPLSGGKKNE